MISLTTILRGTTGTGSKSSSDDNSLDDMEAGQSDAQPTYDDFADAAADMDQWTMCQHARPDSQVPPSALDISPLFMKDQRPESSFSSATTSGAAAAAAAVQSIVPPRSQSTSRATTTTTLIRPDNVPQAVVVRYRPIQACDRAVIQQLHEEWFPVKYVDEFYDELCHFGRMAGSGNPLFSSVAVVDVTTDSQSRMRQSMQLPQDGSHRVCGNPKDETFATTATAAASNKECIVGCVVGCFLRATVLSASTQELLVNNVQRHPRLFYIMTVGTVTSTRQAGLGTTMIQQCIQQVQADVGCGVLYLHVLVDNVAAIHMYERLGFFRVQEIPSYYNINGALHNCYLYAMYFHGNRGHRALYNVLSSTFVSLWQRVKSVSSLWTSAGTGTNSTNCKSASLHATSNAEQRRRGGDNDNSDDWNECNGATSSINDDDGF